MVVLSRIATRAGDDGLTQLGDLSRVSKTDPRIEAVGSVAEAAAAIGVARAFGLAPRLDRWAEQLLQELFDLGADLATPLPAACPVRSRRRSVPRVDQARTAAWDQVIQDLAEELGPLRSFVLPGGPPAAAHLHLAVTVARRAERAAWHAAGAHGIGGEGGLNPEALRYLNRLSDLLFQLARAAGGEGELWRPESGGGVRAAGTGLDPGQEPARGAA
ncbi:MAG: cob(I)yrinic acid a,c-diamide adenosyltransferase [Bifidobacteriaceae bacterium]|jgi:cob(I)alamin adenosyltransferase|nr:cob(I)yrinic acid a,c-diamide adenosyltransferase [Bifidobacteriaceae bacterium]